MLGAAAAEHDGDPGLLAAYSTLSTLAECHTALPRRIDSTPGSDGRVQGRGAGRRPGRRCPRCRRRAGPDPGGASSPHWARRSAVVCTPPNDVAAKHQRRGASGTGPRRSARRGRTSPRRGSGASAAAATAYAGSAGRPGQRTPCTAGRAGQQLGHRGGVRCLPGQPQVQRGQRPVREPGVERARDAAGRVAPGGQPRRAARRRSGARRTRAAGPSGRSAPWCRRPPPGRRRAPAAAARAAWRWCCPPPAARRPRARPPASAAMSHTSSPGWPASPATPAGRRRTPGTARRRHQRHRDAQAAQRVSAERPGRVVAVGRAAPPCRRAAAAASSAAVMAAMPGGEDQAGAALQLADGAPPAARRVGLSGRP